MASIFDFLKRLYVKRQQTDDAVLRRLYQIAEMSRTDPTIIAARQIFEQELGLPGQEFDQSFASYWLSLEVGGKSRDWNAADEALMRSVGITENSILTARTNFTVAVLNRVFLRIAMDGSARRGERSKRGAVSERVEPPALRGLEQRDKVFEAARRALEAMAQEAMRVPPKGEA